MASIEALKHMASPLEVENHLEARRHSETAHEGLGMDLEGEDLGSVEAQPSVVPESHATREIFPAYPEDEIGAGGARAEKGEFPP